MKRERELERTLTTYSSKIKEEVKKAQHWEESAPPKEENVKENPRNLNLPRRLFDLD